MPLAGHLQVVTVKDQVDDLASLSLCVSHLESF